MQAVDQFNKLMSLFSLSNAHTFTKYYKKVAMVLMDFVLVNAYLHHKLYIDSKNSKTFKPDIIADRTIFMENLIEAMLNTDFSEMVREEELKSERRERKRKYDEDDSSDDENYSKSSSNDHFYDDIDEGSVNDISSNKQNVEEMKTLEVCRAVTFDIPNSSFEERRKKYRTNLACKVCQFEGRGNMLKKTVFCQTHTLSLWRYEFVVVIQYRKAQHCTAQHCTAVAAPQHSFCLTANQIVSQASYLLTEIPHPIHLTRQ